MAASDGSADWQTLLRPEVQRLPGYEPVEPVELLAERLGIAPERIAKLDGNENPYGPSPRAVEAVATLKHINIYSDPDQRRLRSAIARSLGVTDEYIVAGAGSDELIQMLCAAFLAPGDSIIDLIPTFGMYTFEADVAAARTINVPRRADFSVDVAAVAEAMDERTKLIFATSPNNPTGNLMPREELDGLLDLGVVVAVDEAYIEFADAESFVPLIAQHPNLVVLRTFSKWAGLAGLRLGYGVMAPELAEVLFRIKQPYNINIAAEVAGIASLEDAQTLLDRVDLIVEERQRLFAALHAIRYLEPLPSRGNFILCNVREGNARQIRDRLREHGVFIRHFDREYLHDRLRISVGLPQHTAQLIDALVSVGRDLGLTVV
jgi:histidinol-phosphate aminotransferase